MLARIGLNNNEELFAALPEAFRNPTIELPKALAESELVSLLEERASDNADYARPSFLGAGAYRRAVPTIATYLASRSEFVTAYTPYQPEISQGTLQSAFEYQSVVCELTGMDVSNTGLYDVASATAEACLLAARATGRGKIVLLEPIHPNTIEVVKTYAYGAGLHVDVLADVEVDGEGAACLVAQQPDFLGTIRDLYHLADTAHAAGALFITVADPFALGLLRTPGDAGADIVSGEGRDLAGGTNFGGPSLGLFAVREEYLRQLPGRIVGRTHERADHPGSANGDSPPRTGYVLTLQAREQFIRRERATSNFSTGQSLIALAFTVAIQALGRVGLRESAELCYQRAHDAAAKVNALRGYEVIERGPWFQEFLVRGPLPPAELRHALGTYGITAGLDLTGRHEPEAQRALLFAVTEATPPGHVELLIEALAKIGAKH
jgi:glycine dehydrogenase subunit 1